MTTLDAANHLYEWFSNHDSFTVADVPKIILVSDQKEIDSAAFLSAINEYVKLEIVDPIICQDRTYWILKKPLSSFIQNVRLSPETAKEIAAVIGVICERIQDSTDLCDAKNITEKDILNLVFVCKHMANSDDSDASA